MSITTIIFYAFALLTAAGAATLALSKNVIYAAWLLFIVLFGMAAMYIFAGANFLAVSQVIIYVGGILVILLFGIMLTQKLRGMKPKTGFINLLPGALIASALFLAFLSIIRSVDFNQIGNATTHMPDDVNGIGKATLTQYLLPFELISVLLLAALIGAAYLTRKHSPKSKEEKV
ncbi:MAG TPA: NADH-quinone oxidoreductase subunit J [Bacteroidetes bacterium]|nr:NADH-quinone oxidoreductase subunit J [Bacteroidota bacterium]